MTDRPLPISCYIRTLNEERNIVRCVEAARQVVDEVVVVDSGSTDGTIALAEAAGARVVKHAWHGFGFQKRIAEEACRNDWLLDLDADEVVTPALAAQIRAEFERGEPKYRVYAPRMVMVSPAGRRYESFANAWRNKLYDRRVVRQPEHKAWDQFKLPPGVWRGLLPGPLDHYAWRDLAHLMAKQNSGSSAMARDNELPGTFGIALRVLFGLPVYFFKAYVTRGYFKGGVEGFSVAGILAIGRWLRDVKRYERAKLQPPLPRT